MVACIDFFEMSELCRPKFIVRHSTLIVICNSRRFIQIQEFLSFLSKLKHFLGFYLILYYLINHLISFLFLYFILFKFN
jgi:hypothetical protein